MEDVRRAGELEKLMSELSWLKRLASALVRDESDANDLVQETWLVAAEHAPTDGRPLKPWLSRVALNLVRMRSRADKRRVVREASVERAVETAPRPDDLVSRVRAQRIVADEVLRLAEPYRNTVLLHYFEDLSSAEIARRFGVPEGTVRRRLKVALDELRGRLHAEERKTGHAVVAALAPLAVKQSAAGSAALGVLFVKKLIAVGVVIIGLILLGSIIYKHRDRTSAPAVAEVAPGSGAARAVASPSASHTAHVVVAVTDSAGPVANAFVRCAPTEGDVVVAKTASDGTAALDLAAGEWSIAASADGHEPGATTLAAAAGRDDRVKLVLALGGQTLTGIVTDVTGGVIAGARIDAARLDLNAKPGGAVAIAFSDPGGHYKLAIGAGEILVVASHPEYAAQPRYVDLGANGATASFALVPGGAIEGIVRDAQTKQPVAGAGVHAAGGSMLELAGVNEHIVQSDAAGKFRIAGLAPGTYQVAAREGVRSSRVPVGIGIGVAEQQANIVVLISAMGTIHGKVLDDSGAPAPNITVSALGNGSEETISDAAGAFAFRGLSPGRWALQGTSDTFIADGNAIAEVAKADVEGVVVHVRHGLEVRGHVEPREVCEVEIAKGEHGDLPQFKSVTTNADGAFHFAPFGPGIAMLVARCPSGDQGKTTVTVAADREQIVPVVPGGSIAGRVVDTSGKPIAGVMVTAEVAGQITRFKDGAMVSGFKAMTATTGGFEIGGLGAATYRLSVLDAGLPMKATKAVKLALSAAQHASGADVVVERPDGTIQGTVTGPGGAAVSDAWVTAHQVLFDPFLPSAPGEAQPIEVENQPFGNAVGAHDPPPVITDASGHFALTDLPRGKYSLTAIAHAGALRGGADNVTTDAETSIRVVGVGSLHGTVRGPHGPTDLFSITLTGPSFENGSFTEGAFTFPRLDPGDYPVDVEASDGTANASVQVASDRDASLDIVLVANGTVTGRVVGKDGKPLSGRGVALIADQPPGKLSIMLHAPPGTTEADGRFQVQGPPGPRTLVILGAPPTAKRGVAVTSGTTLDVGDVTVD